MWLRSKVGISGGSAKLVANVILQNQEKERNNANGCLPSLSHPLATKVRKKKPKNDNDDEHVICHNCCSSCNKYNSKKGKKQS